MDMYGFRFCIWQPVYHNNVFSHNAERYVTVDAENEKEARKQVSLRDAYATKVSDSFVVRCEDEYIQSVYCMGLKSFTTIYDSKRMPR